VFERGTVKGWTVGEGWGDKSFFTAEVSLIRHNIFGFPINVLDFPSAHPIHHLMPNILTYFTDFSHNN
jgi:hypothetical protein